MHIKTQTILNCKRYIPFLWEFKSQEFLQPEAEQCCGILEDSLIFTVSDDILTVLRHLWHIRTHIYDFNIKIKVNKLLPFWFALHTKIIAEDYI